MRRYHTRSRAPNAHAIAVGQRIRQIKAANPGISPQQALSMASKQTSRSGSGMFIAPRGRGLYLHPRHRIGFY